MPAPTHGMSHTKTYRIWKEMKRRCYNKNREDYKYYGSKGIKVCYRWINSFENFFSDMGEQPKGMLIDRINSNKNYGPRNCRWVTPLVSSRNRTHLKKERIGRVTKYRYQWIEQSGLKRTTVISRLGYGWTFKEAIGL